MVYLLYCNYYYFILYMFESDTPVFVNIILKNDILEKHFTISVTKYNSLRTSYCYTNIVILLICKVHTFLQKYFFYASFYSMSFFCTISSQQVPYTSKKIHIGLYYFELLYENFICFLIKLFWIILWSEIETLALWLFK